MRHRQSGVEESFTYACRKNINRAYKENVRVFAATTADHIREFYRIYIHTMDRNQALNRYYFPLAYFLSFFEQMPDNARYVLAEYRDQIVAATLYLHDDTDVYSYLGGADQAFQQVRPTNAVVYDTITWAQQHEKQRLILGGGYQPDDGIFRFKAGFSPLRARFHVYRHVHLPDEYAQVCTTWLSYYGRHELELDCFPAYRMIPQSDTRLVPCQIPMSSPDITADDIAAVNAVLQTPVLSIGPQLEAFERASADYVGARHGVGVSSGTAGLHLGVVAAGVEQGDLVITSPFSFIASANCILYERGVPIFVDVDPQTGNIDPAKVAEAAHDLAQGDPARWLPRAIRDPQSKIQMLKSILPVHAFGQPADMDPILDVAQNYQLSVIEDACEAIGAEYKGRQAGTLGHMGVFAFYPNKQMTTGEGGLIVTDDEDWAGLFRSLRNQGRDVFDAWLNHSRLGYNYRLDEMSAALGLSQIGRLDELLNKRAQVAAWYNTRLQNEELIEVPHIVETTTRMSWFVYVVRIKPPASRGEVMRGLQAASVPAARISRPFTCSRFTGKFGYHAAISCDEYLGDVSLALRFPGDDRNRWTMSADSCGKESAVRYALIDWPLHLAPLLLVSY
jgi:dTDP-4-amino-4,6-dideoxygalactose transaminase